MVTADIAMKNWLAGMQGASTRYTQGIQGVTSNPASLAAAATQKYLAGTQDAVSSGRMAAALGKVTLQSWQQAAINKGASRLASGATQASAKVHAFMAKFLPVLANNVAQVRSMPSDTFDQRVQRMVTMANLNHQFSNT